MRLSDEQEAELDELAHRLGTTNRTEVLRLALHSLREQTGLLKLDSIALTERIIREHGDDATIKFKVADVEQQRVEITVNGQPVDGMHGFVMYATIKAKGRVVPPQVGFIVAKDEETSTVYGIGTVPLKVGAVVEVRVGDLPDKLQTSDGQTPEQRRESIRMNAALRRARGIEVD